MKNHAFTRTDIIASIVICSIVAMLIPPLLAQEADENNRAKCARNLRGLMNANIIYSAQNNDCYPWLPGKSATTYDVTLKPDAGESSAEETIQNIYKDELYPNNPYACLWQLCLMGLNPKLFICPEDAVANKPADLLKPADLSDGAEKLYYRNFQDPKNVSYSAAYMWAKRNDKIVASLAWRNTADASLPVLSDMAPYLGTKAKEGELATQDGKMPEKLADATSPNHAYAGQNVAYADVHVDWVKNANVGMSNKNIWAQGKPGKEQVVEAGTLPAEQVIQAQDGPPYDIVMIPTRTAKGELK